MFTCNILVTQEKKLELLRNAVRFVESSGVFQSFWCLVTIAGSFVEYPVACLEHYGCCSAINTSFGTFVKLHICTYGELVLLWIIHSKFNQNIHQQLLYLWYIYIYIYVYIFSFIHLMYIYIYTHYILYSISAYPDFFRVNMYCDIFFCFQFSTFQRLNWWYDHLRGQALPELLAHGAALLGLDVSENALGYATWNCYVVTCWGEVRVWLSWGEGDRLCWCTLCLGVETVRFLRWWCIVGWMSLVWTWNI